MHPAYSGFTSGWTALQLDPAVWKQILLQRIEEWLDAVNLQHDRLLAQGSTNRGDIRLYVIAANDVRRAVEGLNKRYRNAKIASAISSFDSRVPNLNDLRDFLEHFDAYDNRSGKKQTSTKRITPTVPKDRMGQFETYSFPPGDAVIEVFGRRLGVRDTTPAVRALANAVLTVAKTLPEWGEPHP